MQKLQFRSEYKDKILLHFDWELFINSNNFFVELQSVKLSNFLTFYMPWYSKKGRTSTTIEEVLRDDEYKAVKVEDVVNEPGKWPFLQRCSKSSPEELHPIPLGHDLAINKSLILDGNKTICCLLNTNGLQDRELQVVIVQGHDLRNLITDFKVLHRAPAAR